MGGSCLSSRKGSRVPRGLRLAQLPLGVPGDRSGWARRGCLPLPPPRPPPHATIRYLPERTPATHPATSLPARAPHSLGRRSPRPSPAGLPLAPGTVETRGRSARRGAGLERAAREGADAAAGGGGGGRGGGRKAPLGFGRVGSVSGRESSWCPRPGVEAVRARGAARHEV